MKACTSISTTDIFPYAGNISKVVEACFASGSIDINVHFCNDAKKKDDAKVSGDQLYQRLLKDPIGAVSCRNYYQWLGVYHPEL